MAGDSSLSLVRESLLRDAWGLRKNRHSLVCRLQALMFSVVTHSYSWCLCLSCGFK